MPTRQARAKTEGRRRHADASLAGQRILRRFESEAFTGYRSTQFDDAVAKGQLPAPISLGERAVGWLEEELISWREFKVAERDRATSCSNWREFHDAKRRGAA